MKKPLFLLLWSAALQTPALTRTYKTLATIKEGENVDSVINYFLGKR